MPFPDIFNAPASTSKYLKRSGQRMPHNAVTLSMGNGVDFLMGFFTLLKTAVQAGNPDIYSAWVGIPGHLKVLWRLFCSFCG